MRLPNLNFARLLAFAIMVAIIIDAWIPGLFIWLAVFAAAVLGAVSIGNILIIVGSCIAVLGGGVYAGLPIYTAVPLVLVLLGLAGRFGKYVNVIQFPHDFALGLILLIGSALWGSVSLGSAILFFGLGLVLAASFSAEKLENSGEKVDRRALSRILPVFIVVTILVALVVGAVLSPEVLQFGLAVIRFIYNLLIELLVILIIRPFAWLMSPFFEWAANLEAKFEWEPPTGMERDLFDELPSRPDDPGAVDPNSPIIWVVMIALGTLAAYLIIRRLLTKTQPKEGNRVQDERESVFSREEILANLQQTLGNLVRPLAKVKSLLFGTSADPTLQVRAAYTRFVMRVRKRVPFSPWFTPREYKRVVAERLEEPERAQVITKLYEQARYGLTASSEDVNQAQGAVDKLRFKR